MIDTLQSRIDLFASLGAVKVLAKNLSPNDNSKNQIYLGGDFSVLNIIPHGEVVADSSTKAGSIRDRAKAKVNFYWLANGSMSLAPNTKLILYPKYPEVRMSGFLQGCDAAPSDLMTVRQEGRIMLLGITDDNKVIGSIFAPQSAVANEIAGLGGPNFGVFINLTNMLKRNNSSKTLLLEELALIARMEWVPSQRLNSDGNVIPYSAQNGGGYTLEALLGIQPNGLALPDFYGWEVKQFGVKNFETYVAKSPVTLLTPEPNGGIYRDYGANHFIQKFGYPDKSGKVGRYNFGGRFVIGGDYDQNTGLKLTIDGFNIAEGKIDDMDGCLSLISKKDEVAASWSFTKLMSHWKVKHASAVYVPSLKKISPLSYRYASIVDLHEKTDFLLFLKAVARGDIYYDPGIKIEVIYPGKTRTKKRSQFRTNHKKLHLLYENTETIDVITRKVIT